MCGRYYLLAGQPKLEEIIQKARRANRQAAFEIGEIFPGTDAPILIGYQHKIYARFAHWGFYQHIINARSETVVHKKAFAHDFIYHRALIPVSGFYEWDQYKKRHAFSYRPNELFYLAGLYNDQREFTILTTQAQPPVSTIHDRMPLIIPKEKISDWLFDEEKAKSLLSEDGIPLVMQPEQSD